MENLSESKKETSPLRSEEKPEFIIVSLDIVPVDDVDTIFVKLKNTQTGFYLIRTPQEIIMSRYITDGLHRDELAHINYLAGYEHNARGACMLDEDNDDEN